MREPTDCCRGETVMKRATALRYCKEIHDRLTEVNGRLPTPRGEFTFITIEAVWVFGSTAKGSAQPRDLDILVKFGDEVGALQSVEEAGFDPAYYRSCGFKRPRSSRREALMWLTHGMRGVSRHYHDIESIPIDVKRSIFPTLEEIE